MKNSRYAVAGLVAGLVGLGFGRLTAATIDPGSAPLFAVASSIVDLTPQSVKQWAIETFGTGDKTFLLSVVGIVAIALFAATGLLARGSYARGAALISFIGVICLTAALTRPGATVWWAIPSSAAVVLACGALYLLRRALDTSRHDSDARTDRADRPRSIASESNHSTDAGRRTDRRLFLKLSGAAVALGAAGAVAGQWLIVNAQRVIALELPRAARPLPELPVGLEAKVPGISRFRTPSTSFYRVDTALTVPAIDPRDWTLTVDGDVRNPLTLNFDDLIKYEVIERDITMTCVSNEVGGPYVGATRWLGVRVSDVLADAGIRGGVDQIFSRDVDGMTISTPIDALTDDREALLAFGMDGAQLPREHGFPVRLVTPRLYGFVGSTKWVTRLTATTYAADRAYWTERGWVTDGVIHTQSRIDVPRPLQTVAAGEVGFIGGVAWAQGRGIAKVEVRVDDGPWQETVLGPDAGIDYWRQWYLTWTPQAGRHTLRVRATDSSGAIQGDEKAPPFPGGATGQQSLVVICR